MEKILGILLPINRYWDAKKGNLDIEIREYIKKARKEFISILFFSIENVDLEKITTKGIIVTQEQILEVTDQPVPMVIYRPSAYFTKQTIKQWRELLLDRPFHVIGEHFFLRRKHILKLMDAHDHLAQHKWDLKQFDLNEFKKNMLKNDDTLYLINPYSNRLNNWIKIQPQEGLYDKLFWIITSKSEFAFDRIDAVKKILNLTKNDVYVITKPLHSSNSNQPLFFYNSLGEKNSLGGWTLIAKYTADSENNLKTWDEAVQHQFSQYNNEKKDQILLNLEKVFLTFFDYIHLYYPGLYHLGLQFVLDENGFPYFHTIKSKNKYLNIIKKWDKKLWIESMTNPIELAAKVFEKGGENND